MESKTSQTKRHHLRSKMMSKITKLNQYYLKSNNVERDIQDKAVLSEDQ